MSIRTVRTAGGLVLLASWIALVLAACGQPNEVVPAAESVEPDDGGGGPSPVFTPAATDAAEIPDLADLDERERDAFRDDVRALERQVVDMQTTIESLHEAQSEIDAPASHLGDAANALPIAIEGVIRAVSPTSAIAVFPRGLGIGKGLELDVFNNHQGWIGTLSITKDCTPEDYRGETEWWGGSLRLHEHKQARVGDHVVPHRATSER